MAIFTNTMTGNYYVPACEGYSFDVCGHYDALIESLEDDLAITQAMHACDMVEISAARESSFDSSAVTEAADGVFARIREGLKKLWTKIKAFFGSIFRYLTTYFKSGAEFIKANDKALRAVMGSNVDFKFKTYKYNFDLIKNGYPNLDKDYKKFENIHVAFRKEVTNNEATESEYKEKIDAAFEKEYGKKYEEDQTKEIEKFKRQVRGLKDNAALEKPETKIDKAYYAECYKFVNSAKDTRDSIIEAQKNSEESFNDTMDLITKLEESQKEQGYTINAYAAGKAKTACTNFNNVVSRMINVQIEAHKEAVGACKSVLLKGITLYQRNGGSLK